MFNAKLLTLVRLALINSIGFAGSTVVPLWVAEIGRHLAIGIWFGGVAAGAQLVASALSNLATPVLFAAVPPITLARRALGAAASAYVLTLFASPALFMAGCVSGGVAFGIVLNATNRILAGGQEVQKGYSVFQLAEVSFGASLFLVGGMLSARYGLAAIFVAVIVVCLLGILLLRRFSVEALLLPATLRRESSGNRVPAILGLLALTVFFLGQSAVNSFMLPIGHAMNLPTATITTVIALGMVCGFGGAALSRVVGERFGVASPIAAVAMLMTAVFVALTASSSATIFAVGAGLLSMSTMFAVPYFFTLLAKLDRTGRYSSIAPAFLLSGVAIGPPVAVFVTGRFDLQRLGMVASAAVLVSAGIFWACAARVRRQPAPRSAVEGTP